MAATERMALVGMDVHFAGCDGLAAFARSMYDGRQHFGELPAQRQAAGEQPSEALADLPQGAYITAPALDYARLQVPPQGPQSPLLPALLLLNVLDRALRDAQTEPGSRVGIVIALGPEWPAAGAALPEAALLLLLERCSQQARLLLPADEWERLQHTLAAAADSRARLQQCAEAIGKALAQRIAALWRLRGPLHIVPGGGSGTARALAQARQMLAAAEVDAVLVGAADIASGPDQARLYGSLAPLHSGTPPLPLPTMAYDEQMQGWLPGEGAGAVVVRRHTQAQQARQRIYAVIDGLSLGSDTAAEALVHTCGQALAEAGIAPAEVGYLELTASGFAEQDASELAGVLRAYHTEAPALSCAIGSASASIGHTFTAAGMAALVRAALCLHQRYIPAVPNWKAPRPADWQHSPFYVASESHPWFRPPDLPRRAAALSSTALDGSHAHLVLTEDPAHREYDNSYLLQMPLRLYPLAADSREALLALLDELETRIDNGSALAQAAYGCFEQWRSHETAAYTLVLVAQNEQELRREIGRARAGVVKAFADGEEWKTPSGSYFTPRPLGSSESMAFVYPGAFNAYVGLGKDMFQLFPDLYERFASVTSDIGRLIGEHLLYPRSRTAVSAEELKQLEARLVDESISMFEIGTSFATLFTLMLRDTFGVQPAFVFGYSQGESAMMHALRVWENSDSNSTALRASDLYRTQLSGCKNAVRAFWGLPAGEPPCADEDLWANYVLMAPPEKVLPHLADEPHVYLAIINAPAEVMLAGDPAACKRVIGKVKGRSLRAPFNHVIHSPPVQSQYDEFVKINQAAVHPDITGISFYSAAEYAPIALTSDTIAHSFARVCCQQLDFARLVREVYAAGARVFVELGPARNCSRWIDAILAGDDHAAMSINKKGVDDFTSLLRVLARLLAHRVPMDISILYEPMRRAAQPAPTDTDTRSNGNGAALDEPLLARPVASAASAEMPPAAFAAQPGSAPPGLDDIYHLQQQALSASTARASTTHSAFLQARQGALHNLNTLVQRYMAQVQAGTATAPTPTNGSAYTALAESAPPAAPPEPTWPARAGGVIWDEADLLEFARGQIAPVFGPEYTRIDSFRRRVRLPLPPYLLVSRVTHIAAERGSFTPCSITTEYDIPHGAWYSVDGCIPWAVAIESGQCDLLLISYLGVDFEYQGERVYRLLGGTLTFFEPLPREGETLRYEISVNAFARSGETLLFFFNYDCYVGERLILQMTEGCAGFFSDQELASGRGIILTEKEMAARQRIERQHFAPPLTCARRSFDEQAMRALSTGDMAACFGAHYAQPGKNHALRLPPERLRMIDRVTEVDPQGGVWGLGCVVAEKDIHPDDWYFPCHFKDDEVLAGSLMAEGCVQLVQFYLLFLGLQTHTVDARFQPIPRLAQAVVCRGQVTPADSRLTYRMEISAVRREPVPSVIANVEIVVGSKTIVRFTDLGIQLAEQASTASTSQAEATDQHHAPPTPRRAVLFDEQQVREFTSGSAAACFGPDFAIFEQRRTPRIPNGDLQMMHRVVSIDGQPHELTPGTLLVSEYDVPADAWYYQENAAPEMPYSVIMEIAMQPCGFLSAYLRTCLLFPDADLYFRNLDGRGHTRQPVDVRGKTITNHASLLSSTFIQGIIIQKFAFRLFCEGQEFYEGDAVFGYFTSDALVNQVGLDGGKPVPPWYEQSGQTSLRAQVIDLQGRAAREQFYQAPPGKPHYRLSSEHLDLLDRVTIITGGGSHQQGYIYASRRTNPAAWFFAAHFKDDPVMPGSLGIEAILQAMQLYALQHDLGSQFASPRFATLPDHQISWKYRGQIVREVREWSLEVHITSIERSAEQVIITGDASVWRGSLRIYELKRLALRIIETP